MAPSEGLCIRIVERLTANLRSNAAWFRNSAAATAGSVIAAGFGFIYWWLAARSFPPAIVGGASALISLMALIGLFGETGLGTFLVGEAQKHPSVDFRRLTLAALLTSLVAAGCCAAIAIAIVAGAGLELGSLASNRFTAILLVVGSASAAAALVLDQSYIGLLKAHLNLVRNFAFSAARLALLGLLALAPQILPMEAGVLATWTLASIASIGLAMALGAENRSPFAETPDFRRLYKARAKVLGHHALNVATQAPGLVLPLVVAVVLGPEPNAAFYPLWCILNYSLLAPASLTTVLYTVVARHPESLGPRMATSLRLSALGGMIVAAVFLFGSKEMLAIFNGAYVEIAGDNLRFLGLGFAPLAIKFHFIALSRLENTMLKASGFLALGGVAEAAFAAAGGYMGGLSGLTTGWLIAVFVQVSLLSPSLIAAMRKQRSMLRVAV
jgi:O-antigen/teichoic acid export membrane protein